MYSGMRWLKLAGKGKVCNTETMMIVISRPWCLLEICAGSPGLFWAINHEVTMERGVILPADAIWTAGKYLCGTQAGDTYTWIKHLARYFHGAQPSSVPRQWWELVGRLCAQLHNISNFEAWALIGIVLGEAALRLFIQPDTEAIVKQSHFFQPKKQRIIKSAIL
ncbi:uncharacterized protein VTP21DRAFT_2578 [Calcarisporiella thermophila]|uniref:uncharacterized protein n=1 Tax=Calcarisporiella thermophila TaxID=911321 RepID=UPI0037434FA1